MTTSRLALQCALALAAVVLPATMALAQAPVGLVAQPTIEKTTGMWVEGPGFDIKYGVNYEQCAARCIATSNCVMIEYYRPEKKCNMYDAVRPLKNGGSSFVGTKKPAKL